MKTLHLLGVSAAMSAALIFAAAETADAQQITPIVNGGHFGGTQITPISSGGHFRGDQFRGGHFRPGHGGGKRRFHGIGSFGGVWIVEREVVREVVHLVEVPVAPPEPPPPPTPRKPFKIGESYDSLPGGCMKLIEEGVSYYHCGGEWYRQVGSGSAVQYKAVARQGL